MRMRLFHPVVPCANATPGAAAFLDACAAVARQADAIELRSVHAGAADTAGFASLLLTECDGTSQIVKAAAIKLE
jgi:hypothetical protein